MEEPDSDEDEDTPRRKEQVHIVNKAYLARSIEKENIIVDTGSNYNIIGRSLLDNLERSIETAGQEMKVEVANKYLQFG